MHSITHSIDIAKIQEFIALSVYNSLIIGFVLAVIIYGIENSRNKLNHQNIYQFYKLGLLILILGPIICSYYFQQNVIGSKQISILNHISNQWDKWLFMFWSSGVMIYLMVLLLTEYYLNRLISRSSNQFSDEWNSVIEKSKSKVHYFKNVLILHSENVNSAFLSGVIKPVLLLPTAWINQISLKELEFILIHELSHLKIKDHYINAMCTVAEVFYFFNPIVHLFIRRIRFQRELCVDELVITHTQQPLQYANCLIKIGEKSIHERSINFSSIKNQLSFRIKNILKLEVDKQEKNKTLKMSTIFCISLMSLVYVASGPKNQLQDVTTVEVCTENINIENSKKNELIESKVQRPINQINKVRKQIKKNEVESNFIKEEFVIDRNNLIDEIQASIAAETSTVTKSKDSSTYVFVLNQPQTYYSTGQRMMIVNNKYLYEKDWKNKLLDNKKIYRYIIINEGGKTILSYSQNLQTINQLSNIN